MVCLAGLLHHGLGIGHRGDDLILFPEPGLELLYFCITQIHSAETGRALECRRSVHKEGFLPLVEERGVDLVLVPDRGDGLPLDEMQTQEPDFLLGGILTADAGGGVLVLGVVFHGWVRFPAVPYLIKSNRTFRLRRIPFCCWVESRIGRQKLGLFRQIPSPS